MLYSSNRITTAMMAHKQTNTRLTSLLVVLWALLAVPGASAQQEEEHSESRFSDEAIPLAELPARPRPLLELGEPFLGTGTLHQGIRMPGGAVWQPALMAFGTVRMAAQGFTDGSDGFLPEAAGRFDLFGNLYLTQSERVVIGFRPLDQDGRFTRLTSRDAFEEEFNFGIRTLFFEGDLGELLPNLDRSDRRSFDIGISVGRQPLSIQDGILLNEDAIDIVGLTRANVRMFGSVNSRVTVIYGWGDIDRPGDLGNLGDGGARLFGLMTETDTPKRTVELDVLYVTSDPAGGDGVFGGFSSIRRYGRFGNTLRVVGSLPIGDETAFTRPGVVIHNQFGWTPHHSHNYVYINTYVGVDQFRSAARSPSAGGPLGQTGILFAAVGLGRYGAALGNVADNSVGGAVGYQRFMAHTRQQVIFEAGARYTYADDIVKQNALAGGVRYQFAVGRRGIVILDGFGGYDLETTTFRTGARFEVLLKL
jgi:hypothetical protein